MSRRRRASPVGKKVAASRLRPASGDLPRAQVSEVQRRRVLAAMTEAVVELGAGSLTVGDIVARAGVSRRTFYELFDDREDCFLAALDDAVAHATVVVLPAYTGETVWREQVRAGLAALLELFDEEPALARLCVVEALGAGPRALEHRARVLDALIDVVDSGGSEAKVERKPPRLAAEGLVGAVLAVIHTRLSQDDAAGAGARSKPSASSARLADLLNPLMGMIVLPYLGTAASRKELARPAPAPQQDRAARTRRSGDPLEGLGMRLTYRTLRVLAAIADHPKASNREIADGAEVADQGQISKLLSRLESLGLIHNHGAGQPSGAPNAWSLTPRGEEIHLALGIEPGGATPAPGAGTRR
jgi:AcrR family transcriptional regulator/DNA-binding MarR family transcriptional regulator